MLLRAKPRALYSIITNLRNLNSYTLPPNPSSPDLANQICRILSDHRNPHHHLELSLTAYSAHISPNLVEQVLKRCKNLGFSAQRFFLWAKTIPGFTHSEVSYRILVEILGSSRQFALLWDFLIELRESQEFDITPEIFWLVFRAYSRADLPSDAFRAFDRMVEFGLKPSVDDLDKLLYVLCKRKHVAYAQQVFDRVKVKFEAGVKSYSILVRGWGDVGDSVSARKVFDEMCERSNDVDVLAYNSLLEALCKGGKVSEAYEIFRGMGSRGIEPDACSYAIFIRAYCEANDVHLAIRVLDEMKRCNLVPNVFTYNCVIKKLCKNERVDEAYEVLNEIFEGGGRPDTWSYNVILAYHCEHNEVNRATKVLSRMVKDCCLPDRHSYNMLLKLLIRIGRFDRATEVWESLGNRGFYPSASTYSVMIHGLCMKNGKLEEACKYFEMMIDEGIPPYSTTVEMLRNRLIGLGLSDYTEILAGKMERSTACSIQEFASIMRGGKAHGRSRTKETESESD
ncbi:pentatricopeptide repeat-containing protein At1g52640, mitochondrial-like [Mercurialis annua]|uniref:pentatricopeptide repeat-containing protein At1g52640, mitochondrial-like n=1 Tax=Mercurialis annua TaxID=3986 RepID=UPI00215F1D33|nr:pentatricopeptide repeat-containing protein At1g52640, mitochondrial-like [Mercurialis annua]